MEVHPYAAAIPISCSISPPIRWSLRIWRRSGASGRIRSSGARRAGIGTRGARGAGAGEPARAAHDVRGAETRPQFPWDFQPLRMASEQYTRNHMDLTAFDNQSRFPPAPGRAEALILAERAIPEIACMSEDVLLLARAFRFAADATSPSAARAPARSPTSITWRRLPACSRKLPAEATRTWSPRHCCMTRSRIRTSSGSRSRSVGPDIAGLVVEVTDDKSLDQAVRKRRQIESAPQVGARQNAEDRRQDLEPARDPVEPAGGLAARCAGGNTSVGPRRSSTAAAA